MDYLLRVRFESLKRLLRKHEDVKNVIYVEDSLSSRNKFEELIAKEEICKINNLNEVCESLKYNLNMIHDYDFDVKAENRNTIEVISAANDLFVYISDKNIELNLFTEDEILLVIETASLLVVFCVTCRSTRRISKLIDENLNVISNSNLKVYYRGHSSAKYNLIPSMFRNLKVKDGWDIINSQGLYLLYNQSGLLEKYEKVFGEKRIDYNFCAFAQHSKAYSPFLDFTEDIKVALSFATKNTGSINDYINEDAAVFSISFNDPLSEKSKVDLSMIDVFVSNKKLNAFSTIRNKPLYSCTYKDFEVEAFILKDKTNDRMKYQKGCFLYFQRAVIVRDILLFPLPFGRIAKYTIPAAENVFSKKNVYQKILNDYNHYKYDYMMNPYKYFEESPCE